MAVQRRARDLDVQHDAIPSDGIAGPGKETQVQRIAAQGVSGGGGAMPFADQIAESFGPAHADTVQSIQAHTGSAATAASEDIGAKAYATGNAVAFAGTPDLHTAAHEAAHVVQQRQGVHLKGGVGAADDPHERHADAVADHVVAGLSAASLLGDAGTAGASTAVQRKEAPKKPSKADEKKAHEQFEADGPMVVYALAGVFRGSKDMMDYMPSKYVDAMHKLDRVVHGDGTRGHQHPLDGRARIALYDEVAPIFEPFARANAHFGGDDDQLPDRMSRLRSAVLQSEASDRVEHAVLIGEGKDKQAVEIPDDKHPREQAEALRLVLPTLLSSIRKMIARATSQGVAGLDKASLAQLQAMEESLVDGDGFLALSEADFALKIQTIKAKFNGVATYSDLVKKFLTLTSQAISKTAMVGGLLMKAIGDKSMALACDEVARNVSEGFGQVIAAVQIVHGISVMLDKNASTDDKIGAGVEIAGGIAVIAAGETMAALPITGPYMLVKGAQYLYSEAVIGWDTDLVRGAFQTMQHNAMLIGRAMEHLAAAQLLERDEKDPERRKALADEETLRTQQLGSLLRSFLRETEYRDHGSDIYEPGNIQIISDAFAGPRSRAGASSPADIVALAHEVSKQMAWCFQRGPAIVQATASHKSIVEVDGIEEKLEKNAKKDK